MTNQKPESNTLKWRFDVNTFRLIGRELITDRITALFELVKNCYDANATIVNINFYNVSTLYGDSYIEIIDNGEGMSFSDISDKWMVIGTNNKRRKLFSPEPFNRRYVGEKGIGRFAVDKLGGELIITTKKRGQPESLSVNINWNDYAKLAEEGSTKLFTDIENLYYYEKSEEEEQGTKIKVSFLNETWSKNDIDRLYIELTKIVSPFYPLNPPFEIYINSNEHEEYNNKLVKANSINFASHTANLTFYPYNKKQEVLKFNHSTGLMYNFQEDYKTFGPIKLHLYFFNESAKRKFNAFYRESGNRIDGIKIYRDGVITTPFAEMESQQSRKRDILGIDKRLYSDLFNKVGSREVIGVVEITKEGNPNIIDSTNRQDFIDNKEYRELKTFIINQIDVFGQVLKYEKELDRAFSNQALVKANEDVSTFAVTLLNIEKSKPELRDVLEPLRQQAQVINKAITQGINEQKKTQEEFNRKENIYLSLMSLQEYAIHIAHAVRTSLGKVKRMAGFFVEHFPDPKHERYYLHYAKVIYEEMQKLNRAIDFMLSYAASNVNFEEFSVKMFIEELLLNIYSLQFETESIKIQVEVRDDFTIYTNKKFFEDILENLISNSIKAMKKSSLKIIKCSSYIEADKFIFLFSDTGKGIDPQDWEKVFEIYYTTTADEGGAGVGLFIVKTRIDALKGTIEVIPSEFGDIGTTFKVTLPFRSNNQI